MHVMQTEGWSSLHAIDLKVSLQNFMAMDTTCIECGYLHWQQVACHDPADALDPSGIAAGCKDTISASLSATLSVLQYGCHFML